MNGGPRRRAREVALAVLHQIDSNPDLPAAEATARYFDHFSAEEDAPDLDAASRAFAESLVAGVAAHRAAIDEVIQRVSRNWRVERMAQVDRNVLRLGTYELQHCPDVPRPVAISEAIELARRYGTEEASAFVNGVLDRVAAELGAGK